jgi:hypothetical protein
MQKVHEMLIDTAMSMVPKEEHGPLLIRFLKLLSAHEAPSHDDIRKDPNADTIMLLFTAYLVGRKAASIKEKETPSEQRVQKTDAEKPGVATENDQPEETTSSIAETADGMQIRIFDINLNERETPEEGGSPH